ncbi:MAG TPA: CoA ester lyase [Nitrososphaerales archaeon]|nr:CoA ester lyase [Nitrososphaerales archaeon]
MLRRSQLYVPGNNEKMITKAPTLGADSIILDLEDAVPEGSKDQARRTVARLGRELDWGSRELCVRINPKGTKEFARDIAAVRRCGRVDAVVVPKAEGDCSRIHRATQKGLIPVIETATGLMRLREVVASKGVVAVSFGAADYAASVGGSVSAYLNNAAVKTLIVAAAAERGVDAIDNVFFDLNDSEGFRREALGARGLGFVGKQVVHPSQVKWANEVFTPTTEEVESARKVLDAMGTAAAQRRGAIRVGDSLVDAVHYRLAERLIVRAKEAGLIS